ncbi:MAG TPA: ATP-binding protein [Thermoanaerobaculia bacterium]|nr:ATP-binding protein [Thermoanaerobaculia bacterium]
MSIEPLEPSGRILLIDLDAHTRARVLSALGPSYEVETGDLAAARERPPGVILLRIGPDGLTPLAELAADPRTTGVPVLLLAAPEHEAACLEGLEMAAADYLLDPFSPQALSARVRARLRSARSRQEARQAWEAVRQSEERFRLATEAFNGLVFDWDLATDRVQRSNGLVNLLGYWPDEIEGQIDWWKRQIHPDDYDRVYNHIMPTVEAGGSSFSIEYRIRHRDGRWIHAWDKGIAVRDEHGKVVRFVGSTLDITDRKRAEEDLREAHREAHAANEAKDRFLATLSHELRTPLTPVLAMVASLEENPRLPEEVRSPLSMVRRNVELEARLIDDLLDLTRIARGKLGLNRRATDARLVIEHAVETALREIEAKGLRLVTDLAPGDRSVLADAPRLTQVLWNLLSNAVKFTPPGGEIAVRSAVEASGAGEELVVSVTDTGIGIEPDVLPRIFDAFEQADRRITRHFGGLGLGLALSRALVELHGGRLTAASDGRGRGATFEVRIPLGGVQIDLDDTGNLFASARPAPAAAPAVRPLRLLFVEDHPDTAETVAELLRMMGHDVSVAGTVAEALDVARGRAVDGGFDLVVSDLGLPDGSGQDLMRELVRLYGVPGIAVSGYGMEEDVRKSREAGFSLHLTKPVTPQMLRDAIQQVAGGPVRG